MRQTIRKGFTLIEILIVVVILGILAAIVVPQFNNASEDAQLSNVRSQLSTVRSQIELYRVRNNGSLPDLGDGSDAAANWAPLIGEEFLRAAPINPRNGLGTINAGDDVTETSAQNDATFGWHYNTATGNIFAGGLDEDGSDNTGNVGTPRWHPQD